MKNNGRWKKHFSNLQIRYVFLLAALILVILFSPTFAHPGFGSVILATFMFIVLFSGIYAISERRGPVLVTLLVALIAASGGVLYFLFHVQAGFFVHYSAMVIFYIFTILFILTDLFRSKSITGRTITGAICVYLLIGFSFATSYYLMENFLYGSFSLAGSQISDPEYAFPVFLYYSFITLTTTGTGDIYPLIDSARALVTFQVICGIFYIAVFITGMISILSIEGRKKDNE